MKREQSYYVFGAIILLAVMFWGFDTTPSTQKTLEKSRVLSGKSFDIHSLESDARTKLTKENLNHLETLQSQAQFAGADSSGLKFLKDLSAFWFNQGNPILAGAYAKQVAEVEQTATSWSITGTTFALVLSQPDLNLEVKERARDQAVEAFENAISIEPKIIEHRINQALSYIEVPDQAQPMKGVQMLAGLATNFPDSPLPPFHLARLAVRTGQMERAVERIEQALKIDSTNSKIACLAIEIYAATNKPEEARKLEQRCAGSN